MQQMMIQLFLGTVLISCTVVIHAVGTVSAVPLLRRVARQIINERSQISRLLFVIIVVLWLFLLHTAEVWLWAACYLVLTDLPDFETALYFSTVSFTTLGYGDVVLAEDWRLLSALQAANGILLFGWSTAFLFAVVRRVWDAKLSETADT
ncbi:MAG: potassium channel family protein [Pseudomonadota bacterium]